MAQQQRSFRLGVGGAVAAGVLGAILWAIITDAINARIGYLALGVGAGVGFAAGRLGKGPENGPLPIIAAVIALCSVVLGDTFGWASSEAHDATEAGFDVGTLDLVKGLFSGTLEIEGGTVDVRAVYKDSFSFFLVIMAALGVFAAYSLCRKQLAEAAATQPAPPVGPPTGEPAPYGAPSGGPVDGPPAFGQPAYGQPAQPPRTGPDAPPSFEKRPEA